MKATRIPISVDGSCQFCRRAKLSKQKGRLEYPYTHILKIEGNSSSINICEDCLDDIKNNLVIDESYTEL